MSRSLNEAAQFVNDSIQVLGLDVKPGSRIYKMYKSLQNKDGSWKNFINTTDQEFAVAREALRDLTLLEFFFDQVNPSMEKDAVRKRINRMLKDSVLPQKDVTHSPGRDVQAELFVFAACRKAGLHPKFKEPDVVCSVFCRPLGIAVKRIKSMDQFVKRVRGGALQIERCNLTGIVIVEVTRAVNPENIEVVAPISDSNFGNLWRAMLKQLIDREYHSLRSTVEGKGVIATILHDHQIRIINSSGARRLETMTYSVPMCDSNRKLQRKLDRFIKRYLSALPNLIVL